MATFSTMQTATTDMESMPIGTKIGVWLFQTILIFSYNAISDFLEYCVCAIKLSLKIFPPLRRTELGWELSVRGVLKKELDGVWRGLLDMVSVVKDTPGEVRHKV